MLGKIKKCVKICLEEKMKSLKYYIGKALKNHFAMGAFNFCNLESLQAIEQACFNLKSPAFISVSESAFSYMGKDYLVALAKSAKKKCPYLFLHLDHGKSFEICQEAIDCGFDSVMIDGSSLTFEDNVDLTQKVCDYAHRVGTIVEGELGQIKGIEDNVASNSHHFTDPKLAKIFVDKTKVDLLAVAIGTSHGAYKYSGEKTLRFDILEEIEKQLPAFPLVLHGASTVDEELVDIFNQNGGNLQNANGIPKELLVEAVKKHNIVKINTDTDIRLAFTSMIRKTLNENPKEIDPRKYLSVGKNKASEILMKKIENTFFGKNQA